MSELTEKELQNLVWQVEKVEVTDSGVNIDETDDEKETPYYLGLVSLKSGEYTLTFDVARDEINGHNVYGDWEESSMCADFETNFDIVDEDGDEVKDRDIALLEIAREIQWEDLFDKAIVESEKLINA